MAFVNTVLGVTVVYILTFGDIYVKWYVNSLWNH